MLENKSLIFFHIAKTAGTTLHAILERNFPPETVISMDYGADPSCIDRFRNLPLSKRAEIKYLHAHMVPVDIHKLLPSSLSIVLLRDPIERVISEYYFIRRVQIHPLHELLISQNMSLYEYATNRISLGAVQSGQTRLLSGIKGVDWVTGTGVISREVLEVAKNNLENQFYLVGLTERFDEFLILLKRSFGWGYGNILYQKLNVTYGRPRGKDLPYEVRNLLEEYNELDIELYEFAKKKFNRLISMQKDDFSADLATFRLLNKIYNYGIRLKKTFRPLKYLT